MYSSVNQAMQMASIISRNGWGSSTPLSFMTLSQKVKIEDEDDHYLESLDGIEGHDHSRHQDKGHRNVGDDALGKSQNFKSQT